MYMYILPIYTSINTDIVYSVYIHIHIRLRTHIYIYIYTYIYILTYMYTYEKLFSKTRGCNDNAKFGDHVLEKCYS